MKTYWTRLTPRQGCKSCHDLQLTSYVDTDPGWGLSGYTLAPRREAFSDVSGYGKGWESRPAS